MATQACSLGGMVEGGKACRSGVTSAVHRYIGCLQPRTRANRLLTRLAQSLPLRVRGGTISACANSSCDTALIPGLLAHHRQRRSGIAGILCACKHVSPG